MKQAVIFGAGNIGRGFIGQLYSESGYHITFCDIDQSLVEAIDTRGSYELRMVTNASTEQLSIGPVSALLGSQEDQVADILTKAELAATAVGARALKYIAPQVAKGIARRAELGIEAPLNIVICENMKDASAAFGEMLREHLTAAERAYMASHIGLADAVIGRMVPQPTEAMRKADTSLIVTEPYKELPVDAKGFVGTPPQVVGMELCDHFAVYTARKLYLHNAGHAVLGYLGYLAGHELGYEALEDESIRGILLGAWDEAAKGISAVYGADPAWLKEHVADLLERFGNRTLADQVVRLGRDPLRKLGPEDRLVGAARAAEQAGILPQSLAWGIAAAMLFDVHEDRMAVALQAHIAKEGVAAVLEQVCHISPDEALGQAVVDHYERLRRDRTA